MWFQDFNEPHAETILHPSVHARHFAAGSASAPDSRLIRHLDLIPLLFSKQKNILAPSTADFGAINGSHRHLESANCS